MSDSRSRSQQSLSPEALLLDFGGTLAVERPGRAAIYAEAARNAGAAVSDTEMKRLMGAAHGRLPLRVEGGFRYSRPWFLAFMRAIFVESLGLDTTRLDGVAAELFARFADPATFELREGARELIERARAQGLGVAIVSNWSDALPGLVRGLGLVVDHVVTSAIEGIEKPDPAIFGLALEALGVRAERAIHLGDSIPNDVEGARQAGVRAIWIDHAMPGPNASADGAASERVTRLADVAPLVGIA